MSKQNWLILANSGVMKLFRFPKTSKELVDAETIENPFRHLRNQDINSDKQGRSIPSMGHQSSAYESRTDLKKIELEHFASEIAKRLNEAAKNHEFEKLYLAVSKEFYGVLKNKLSAEVISKIAEHTQKDLIHEKIHAIWSHFPSAH